MVLWCAVAALVSLLGPSSVTAAQKRRQPHRRPSFHGRRLLHCSNAQLRPSSSNIATVTRATLCLVNRERAAHGLSLLTESRALDQAATHYSTQMVSDGYFSDTSPTGSTLRERIAESGYLGRKGRSRSAGVLDLAENLATASGELATPANIVSAWMASPPHRANLLRPVYEGSGIGVALGMPASSAGANQEPGATYTQYFGTIR